MANPIIRVDFRANATKFFQATDKINKKMGHMGKQMAIAQKKLVHFGGAMVGIAGAAGLGSLVKRSLEAADATAKMARMAGLGTTAFQEYAHVFDLAGVSQEMFANGAGTFNKRLGELKSGTGPLVSFLKKYDEGMIDVLASTGSTDEALAIFLEKMASVKDPAEQAAIAAAGFSKSIGIQMVEGVRAGTEALEAGKAEAHALGKVLSEDLLVGSEQANDAMSNMTSSLGALTKTIVIQMAPAITELSTWLTKNVPEYFKAAQDAVFNFLVFFGDMPGEIELYIKDTLEYFRQLKDDAVGYVTTMISEIKDSFFGGLGEVVDIAKEATGAVGGFFKDVYTAVVGNSYVPDMIEAIKEWFAKLTGWMVKPTEEATKKTAEHFEDLQLVVEDTIDIYKTMGESFQTSMGDMFFDTLEEGKINFKTFADTIYKTFLRLIADMAAAWATMKIFGGSLSIGGITMSSGGLLGNAAGSAVGSKIGSAVGLGSATGWSSSSALPPFLSGGTVGTPAAAGGAASMGTAAAAAAAIALPLIGSYLNRSGNAAKQSAAQALFNSGGGQFIGANDARQGSFLRASGASLDTFGAYDQDGKFYAQIKSGIEDAQAALALLDADTLAFFDQQMIQEGELAESHMAKVKGSAAYRDLQDEIAQKIVSAAWVGQNANKEMVDLIIKNHGDASSSAELLSEAIGDGILTASEAAAAGINILKDTLITDFKTAEGAAGSLARKISGLSNQAQDLADQMAFVNGGDGGGNQGGGFASGGIARGPASGYRPLLHGNEAVIPLGNGDVAKAPVIVQGDKETQRILARLLAASEENNRIQARMANQMRVS